MDNRRNRIEKGKVVFAADIPHHLRQRRRGEGAGRHNHIRPVFGDLGYFLAFQRDHRMVRQDLLHALREPVTVNGQRTAGGHLVLVGSGHDDRSHHPHFFMQNADGVGFGIVRPEAVRTDEFRQPFGLVGVGHAHRAHLVQDHRHAALGDLEGSLASGKSAADHMNGVVWHCCLCHQLSFSGVSIRAR